MAYTMQDFANLAKKEPLKSGVIDVLRRDSFIMETLPWTPVETLAVEFIKSGNLPTVAFRKIGNTFAESKATVVPAMERVFNIGGYFDVDKAYVKSKQLVNQRAYQAEQFVKAMSYSFNDYAINGSPIVDVDGFTGIFYRIMNELGAAQHINVEGGSGLDVSMDSAALAANQTKLIGYIDAVIDACEEHTCDELWMNKSMRLALLAAIRGTGLFASDQDNYGRKVVRWGADGPIIRDLGVKADQTTKIITDVEKLDGTILTTGTGTSIYAVKQGEDYLQGINLGMVDVNDIGMLENGVAYRTVIDWFVGITYINPRSMARLSGIVAA
jgi:hypothetical protein